MNQAFLKVPSAHGYNTTGTNHLWSLPDQLQTEGGQTARLGNREGVYSSARCLEEDCWEHPSSLPGSCPWWRLSHFHCLHSPGKWLSTMSFIRWATKQKPVFGRLSALPDTQDTLHRWSSCPQSSCKPQKLHKIAELHTTWMGQADPT